MQTRIAAKNVNLLGFCIIVIPHTHTYTYVSLFSYNAHR